MDPCPFIRISITNLALNISIPKTDTSFYCKIKLKNHPTQSSYVPLLVQETQQIDDQTHASFTLSKSAFDKQMRKLKPHLLEVEVYAGKYEQKCGFISNGKMMGSVLVDFRGVESKKVCVVKNGWVEMGKRGKFHLNVLVEPDPRFVFRFGGEPECSPQVFLVNGNVKQAVFSCKFGFKNSACDRNLRSSLSSSSESSDSKIWLNLFKRDYEKYQKERKGWSITIHDLSGSPVATASMVTPFVPSTGTNRVSRSNPGAWLILQPSHATWKPWGRLEAWLEHGNKIGYRFEHFPDGYHDAISLTNNTLSTKKGGKFTIDNSSGPSPMSTPSTSFDSGLGYYSDIGSGSWLQMLCRGFVMSSTVRRVGKCSKPEVEVSLQHVTCTEDAAAFVALAAAVDLSMDACRLFSTKLRKELRQPGHE